MNTFALKTVAEIKNRRMALRRNRASVKRTTKEERTKRNVHFDNTTKFNRQRITEEKRREAPCTPYIDNLECRYSIHPLVATTLLDENGQDGSEFIVNAFGSFL